MSVNVVHRSGKFSVEFSALLEFGRQSGVRDIWKRIEIYILSFIIIVMEKKLHDPYSVMKDQAGLLDYLQ